MGRCFFFFNDDGGALRSGASERKAQALKRVQSTKPEGAKRPRMRMQCTKLEAAKRPSRRAGMSAANVGASNYYGTIILIVFPSFNAECLPYV